MSATTTSAPRRRVRSGVTLGTRRRRVGQPERPEPQVSAPATDHVSSLPFLALVTALLGGGLLTLLVINNTLAAGSFEQARLRAEQTLLFESEQALRQDVQRMSSPTQLRVEARSLGLVSAATTAYIDLQTGQILGRLAPAAAGEPVADVSGVDGPTARPRSDLADELRSGSSDGSTRVSGDGDSAAVRDEPSDIGAGGADGSDGASVTGPGPTAYDRAIISGGGR